jgi:Cd2+/Zn2+-exporting ATPase
MGALGSDAAIEAADVVLMDDDPRKLARAIAHARRVLRIVRQNIVLALGVKGAVLLGSALGVFGAWQMPLAIFADVGVAVLAILNAMRTLYAK